MTTSTTYGLMDTDYVKDTVVKRFITAADSRLQDWLDDTEDDVLEVSKSFGVSESTFTDNVDDNGLNYRIKEYIVSYFCMQVCECAWCTSATDNPETEVYKIKYDHYKNKCIEIRDMLTKEMFYYDIVNQIDTVSGGLLFRG